MPGPVDERGYEEGGGGRAEEAAGGGVARTVDEAGGCGVEGDREGEAGDPELGRELEREAVGEDDGLAVLVACTAGEEGVGAGALDRAVGEGVEGGLPGVLAAVEEARLRAGAPARLGTEGEAAGEDGGERDGRDDGGRAGGAPPRGCGCVDGAPVEDATHGQPRGRGQTDDGGQR